MNDTTSPAGAINVLVSTTGGINTGIAGNTVIFEDLGHVMGDFSAGTFIVVAPLGSGNVSVKERADEGSVGQFKVADFDGDNSLRQRFAGRRECQCAGVHAGLCAFGHVDTDEKDRVFIGRYIGNIL